jgi:hypothetical protein
LTKHLIYIFLNIFFKEDVIMCKKMFFLVSLILLITLCSNTMAQLDPASITDGNVYLFENVETDVPDDSANSNTANLVGNPQVVDGIRGKALQFNGTSDGVHIPDAATVNLSTHQNRTVIAMFQCADVDKPEKQVVYEEGGTTRGLTIYVHEGLVYAGGWNLSDYTPEWTGTYLSAPITSGTWYAVAMVLRDGGAGQEDDKFEMWIDGELIDKGPGAELRSRSNDCAIGYHNSQVKFHDGNVSSTGSYFEGIVDEVWMINTALTQIELGGFVGKVWPFAFAPSPADGALHEDTWVSLSWTPGGLAVSHDIYLGENFDDVNSGAEGAFQGNQTSSEFIAGFPGFPIPEGLIPGTTYYWRIDEVNEAEPNSPWKGNVWSFSVPSKTAYNPIPADGDKFIDIDTEFSWTGGFSSMLHYVYFGDNFEDVNNATGALPNAENTYTPSALELDKTYYWRVDEFDGIQTLKGNVWSFQTMPDIPVTDPNLICWWTLEEGTGTRVLDWSGHGNHGDFIGNPKWTIEGYDGGALNFDGAGESVIARFSDETWTTFTVAVWAKSDVLFQSNNSSICATYGSTAGGFQFSYDPENSYRYHSDVDQVIGPASLNWVHLAVSYDGTIATVYYNGEYAGTFTPAADDLLANKFAIGVNRAEDNWFDGSVDDFRVYNKALTQEEVLLAMRGDTSLAWDPSPANNSLPNLRDTNVLTWSPGDNASEHDVYFGTDRNAVVDADQTDTAGVYRGQQSATSYTPPEGVEWGGGPYYWRIDELNTDGTISKGRTWSFTVADFILVDDFESYNDRNPDEPGTNRIYLTWLDGFDDPANGSQVGYTDPPFVEHTIVHGGNQSMPLFYDNTVGISEATMTLTYPRDWTEEGVGILSLWFMGNPAAFIEDPNGTITMTAAGTDIWDTADEFRFAYKQLSGAGSIIAKVESVENTNGWAKAGVMIRESLEPGSKHAFVCVTPSNGVASQARITTDASSASNNQTGIIAPYWVKLERDTAGNFTASHSSDGINWQPVEGDSPRPIPMTQNVYIGLALTSHSAGVTCSAQFSNVQTTGSVSSLTWTQQAIGTTMTSNDSEPMYVALNGNAVVYHENQNAAQINEWTEWTIDLQKFADQGVNLDNVNTISIGFGDKANPLAGGSGMVFFDDIRLYRPSQ